MDENKLNNLTKKLFENIEFEKPPKDFTEKLMLEMEKAKATETVKPKTFFRNKFMFFFILSFGFITLISLLFGESNSNSEKYDIKDKFNLPSIDLSFFNQYFNINLDFSFIAKLILGSIIVLIVIDLISGTLIDKFIDSRSGKESKA